MRQYKKFSVWLQTTRVKLGMSQEDVAFKVKETGVNVSTGSMGNYENGHVKTPAKEKKTAIIKILQQEAERKQIRISPPPAE